MWSENIVKTKYRLITTNKFKSNFVIFNNRFGITAKQCHNCNTYFLVTFVTTEFASTVGVKFINVKRAHFSYKRLFSSYVLTLNKLSYKKFARLTLMKLTVGRMECKSPTLRSNDFLVTYFPPRHQSKATLKRFWFSGHANTTTTTM